MGRARARILGLALLVLLVGCGQDQDQTSGTSQPLATRPAVTRTTSGDSTSQPAITGPLGALEPAEESLGQVDIISPEKRAAFLVPESWVRLGSRGDSAAFGWASTSATEAPGLLLGAPFRVEKDDAKSVSNLSKECIVRGSTSSAKPGASPIIQDDEQHPDGTIGGVLTFPIVTAEGDRDFHGRYRTYFEAPRLLCMIVVVPVERFDELEPGIKQILDSVAIK